MEDPKTPRTFVEIGFQSGVVQHIDALHPGQLIDEILKALQVWSEERKVSGPIFYKTTITDCQNQERKILINLSQVNFIEGNA